MPALPNLWTRLEALDLDAAGGALPFSRRLARDNGWTFAFAQRVVLEYKKFIFLAATCGHPVTPSDEVDQAWHLHLVYTRSYWDELCGQVLGFPLHHGPTKGGAAEGHKFQDWYGRTLQAYVAAFGTMPPADVWPAAAVRFGDAPYFRRVNLRRQWLLPRPRFAVRLGRREWLAFAGVLLLVGCSARTPLNPFNWYGPEFLKLFWGLCFVLLPLALWLRHRGRGPEDEYTGPPPSTYELARLADQGRRVGESALAALVHTGKAELAADRQIKRTAAAPPDEPYERAVWDLIRDTDGSSLENVCKVAQYPKAGYLRAIDAALEAKGLLLSPAERQRLDRIPLMTAAALGLFGLAKLLVGLSRDRPVGYLLVSLFGLGSLVASHRQYYGAWATGRGARLVRGIVPFVRRQQRLGPRTGQTVALSVALFGVAELNVLGLSALAASLAPRPASGGDGGDGGSGCGSSGCGGGGCGGCGGGD